MTVRVNLLPREFKERNRQRRMLLVGALVTVAWVGVLGLLLMAKLAAVDDARADRDTAQAQVNQLQAEIDALSAFQGLASQLATGNAVLTAAMSNEVSWAQLLNDVALTVPTTASLTDLQGTILDLPAGGTNSADVFVADEAGDIGLLSVSGYSIERYAPGVEAVLLRFGQVDNFFQQYLSIASAEAIGDVGVTTFVADVRLSATARTGRYLDGLPEVGR